MRTSTPLPFDLRAKSFSDEIKTFEEAIFHFLSLEDRTRWIENKLLADLRVFQIGYFKRAYGHMVERRNLDEGILIYCVAGKGYYTALNTTWNILPGDLLYCYPKKHHCYGADPKDPWTIHWMHASGERMTYFRKLIGFTLANPVFKLGVHMKLIDLFRSLYSLYVPIFEQRHFTAVYACAQHLLASIAMTQRPAISRPQWEQEVLAVMNYMEKCVDQKLQLEDFSDYIGLSRFHFTRRFELMAGVSPMRYFRHLKIKKACFLLETSSLKIKAISNLLGFESEYYFSRCFKADVGCSPQNYCKNK